MNKDPFLLGYFLKVRDVDSGLIQNLQRTNRDMPPHTVALVKRTLDRLRVANPKIVVAGLAFKSGTDDTRYSPGLAIARALKEAGFELVITDPYVREAPEWEGKANVLTDIYQAVENANLLVFASDHQEYKRLDLRSVKRKMNPKCGIVDGRHVVNPSEAIALGFEYEGVGRPKEAFV